MSPEVARVFWKDALRTRRWRNLVTRRNSRESALVYNRNSCRKK